MTRFLEIRTSAATNPLKNIDLHAFNHGKTFAKSKHLGPMPGAFTSKGDTHETH